MRLSLALSQERPLPGVTPVWLKKVAVTTCVAALPRVFHAGRRVTLDVASISEASIQRLNREFRKRNRSTDILSFGNFDSPRHLARERSDPIDLGQLVLSPDFIRRSAREDGVSWKRELAFVFSHGILHLLGFDHSPAMFALQDRVTDTLVPPRRQKTT